VGAALTDSAWGAVLHTGAGALLGAAVVAGSAVEGAVVAYQVAWVFFLAPYGILAQPIHTAILPELVADAGDPARFTASVRWAVERIAALVLPVSALLVALAGPGMRLVAFGEATDAGAELLAVALASLSVGLLPYSAFLLLARVSYALGDSRTPGTIALGSAAVGIVVMGAGAAFDVAATERVALLGAGHTAAYVVGTLLLGRRLQGRLGAAIWPASTVRILVAAVVAGGAAWTAQQAVEVGEGRGADLVSAGAGGLAGLAVLVVAVRLLHLPVPGRPGARTAGSPPVGSEPA
jgi:putative peptidoglycan lipid II flippase